MEENGIRSIPYKMMITESHLKFLVISNNIVYNSNNVISDWHCHIFLTVPDLLE